MFALKPGRCFAVNRYLPGLLLCCSIATAADWTPRELQQFTVASCRGWPANAAPATGFAVAPAQISPIMVRERRIGSRYRLPLADQQRVELDVIERGGKAARFFGSLFNRFGDPLSLLVLTRDCEFQLARRINYNASGQALNIDTLNEQLEPDRDAEWLNPPLEFVAREARELKHPGDATPLRVAMIDSGVNYQLAEINRRLARDQHGQFIGYDFWDMDALPFDAHPLDSGFFLQRHGTRTASLLLAEAPAIDLVPYRYPRPDMSRMSALVEHAAKHGIAIIGMPLGSNRVEDWGHFAAAARAHPEILFIASAGNNGRDIDRIPVYPAALDLDNMLVVSSSDDFVRPAERTNWGRISVDYLLPAEQLDSVDFSGRSVRVSGSSYAVARMTALAARIKMGHRQWQAKDIIAELSKRYGGLAAAARDWVSSGYIADPLAGEPVEVSVATELELQRSSPAGDFRLALDILVLDSAWTRVKIDTVVQQAYDILGQCGITADLVTLRRVESADYLRDLSVGNAHTLFNALPRRQPTVVFARDTRKQIAFLGEAFGRGNTGSRPWLTNSVWLMLGVDDAGVALAHELFHLLVNSGAHVRDSANLMQGDTRPDSLTLTGEQCLQAQTIGVTGGLLQRD